MKMRYYLNIEQDDYIWDKLEWLGIFSDTKVGLKDATPAQILQKILEDKWTLEEDDKDMIVMWHKFTYELNGQDKEIHSSLVYIGEDQTYTAMSDKVGLPVAICAKLILNGTIKTSGVKIPIVKEIYQPVMAELEAMGMKYVEKQVS
jgi:saccharopine dehydrogenase (NAD+, L-glutamate forming)